MSASRPDLLRAGGERSAVERGMGGRFGYRPVAAIARRSPLPTRMGWNGPAEQRGFLDAAQGPLYKVIPDYVLPGISNEALATILAGVFGTLLVLGVTLAVAYTRRGRSADNA